MEDSQVFVGIDVSKICLDVAPGLREKCGRLPMTQPASLADLPELGTVSGGEISAPVGVAPFNQGQRDFPGQAHCLGRTPSGEGGSLHGGPGGISLQSRDQRFLPKAVLHGQT